MSNIKLRFIRVFIIIFSFRYKTIFFPSKSTKNFYQILTEEKVSLTQNICQEWFLTI